MSFAYANRSAVYLKLGQYKNCIENINFALANGSYPAGKKTKLMQRLKKCEQMLNDEETNKNDAQEEDYGNYILKLSFKPNEKVPMFAECLELKTNSNYGRHIVTNKKLHPGDVIAIEKFFVHALDASIFKSLKEANCVESFDKIFYAICSYCLESNSSLNLHACPGCTHAMYCSAACEKNAYEEWHKYECEFYEVIFDMRLLMVRNFFKALSICNGSIEELEALIMSIGKNETVTVFDFDFSNLSENEINRKMLLATYCAHRRPNEKNKLLLIWFKMLFHSHPMIESMMRTHEAFIMEFMKHICESQPVNRHGFSKLLPKIGSHKPAFAGSVLCPALSLLNHSCVPNVIRVENKKSLVLVANQIIEAGEQIFDCYKLVVFK